MPAIDEYSGNIVSPAPLSTPARESCVDCPGWAKAIILSTILAIAATLRSSVYRQARDMRTR